MPKKELRHMYSVMEITGAIDDAIFRTTDQITNVSDAFRVFCETDLKRLDDAIAKAHMDVPLTENDKKKHLEIHFTFDMIDYIKEHGINDMDDFCSMVKLRQKDFIICKAFEKKMEVVQDFIVWKEKKIYAGIEDGVLVPGRTSIKYGSISYASKIECLYEKALLIRMKGLCTEKLMEKIREYEAQGEIVRKMFREMCDIYQQAEQELKEYMESQERVTMISEIDAMIQKIKDDSLKWYQEKLWGKFEIGMLDKMRKRDLMYVPEDVLDKIFEELCGCDSLEIRRHDMYEPPRSPFVKKGDSDYYDRLRWTLGEFLEHKDKISP